MAELMKILITMVFIGLSLNTGNQASANQIRMYPIVRGGSATGSGLTKEGVSSRQLFYPSYFNNGLNRPVQYLPPQGILYCGGYNEVDCSSLCYYRGCTYYQCRQDQCYCF